LPRRKIEMADDDDCWSKTCLFLGGWPDDVKESDVKQFVGKEGDIKYIKLPKRNFCFVVQLFEEGIHE
jgi:hypothetical protein